MIREREEEASPLVCAVVEHALLVEQVQHAGGLALDELNALGGVGETHAAPVQPLVQVLLLSTRQPAIALLSAARNWYSTGIASDGRIAGGLQAGDSPVLSPPGF